MSITRALLSVSDKTGIVEFARFLASRQIELLSTGGTYKALKQAGIAVKEVSEHTQFPEMLDGRVKTLHPLIHGGLLGIRGNAEHEQAMREHHIQPIDLVVVNLYPFAQTVARGAGFDECIENIDIGGPSMLRSAAKNHASVSVVCDPEDYARVQAEIEQAGNTSAVLRRALAAKVYATTAAYDAAISRWFAAQEGELFPQTLHVTAERIASLRYGENPHQAAAFYQLGDASGLAAAKQLQGKELSYNNLNDAGAALALVAELSAPACVIVKHANPCGVALGSTAKEAYARAFAADPKSAFGGIIAFNCVVDAEAASQISQQFAEVILAPGIAPEAADIFATKKNLRVLECSTVFPPTPQIVSVPGGFLVQESNQALYTSLQSVGNVAITPKQQQDADLAFAIVKHVKSNAITLVRDGVSIGIGAGQMSRVDAVRIAIQKAEEFGFDTRGAVLASDAFFPFADNVELAAKAGIAVVIQPGGSVRDDEVIQAANAHNMAMLFTGMRHFRH